MKLPDPIPQLMLLADYNRRSLNHLGGRVYIGNGWIVFDYSNAPGESFDVSLDGTMHERVSERSALQMVVNYLKGNRDAG